MSNRYSNLAHNAMSRVKDSYSIELSKIADMSLSDFCKLCPATSDKACHTEIKSRR